MPDMTALPLMEHFYTIQGEGVYTGHAAYFLRLGGCDVGCVWCDVKESWDAGKHPLVAVDEMVRYASASGSPIAVITGGEPAMHDLTGLTRLLRESGIRAHIETSGAHPITGEWDWICLSPKKFKSPVDEAYGMADELKVIAYHKSDLNWALEQAARVRPECRLLLQPEWSKSAEMTPLVVDFVRQHPRWQVSLQTHKYMNIP